LHFENNQECFDLYHFLNKLPIISLDLFQSPLLLLRPEKAYFYQVMNSLEMAGF